MMTREEVADALRDLTPRGEYRQEQLADDRIRLTWIDSRSYELCSVVFTLSELATLQRDGALTDPPPVRRLSLRAQKAAVGLQSDLIDLRLNELEEQHSELRRDG